MRRFFEGFVLPRDVLHKFCITLCTAIIFCHMMQFSIGFY
ncbi:hypothetical protein DCCM_3200 [Desulfocucumis palustris]|uniref:Uncharacterized protein n=1 Tax=Desulfocucumis palustris TaxID=1898651 RepID=A0A2L2XCW7_9FIRM|nr:hypothetical protein DCCM_3200 [Desulfocucumis palustris]